MENVRNLTCKTNPIKRTRGGNAVAAAAYRAGENLRDEKSGKIARYAARSGDVRESFIRSVEDAPEWHYDRAALWNNIEAHETRKNSRTGRDVMLGLAWELEPEQQRAAVIEFADREFVARGHVVDIAFHKYGSVVKERDSVLDDATGHKIIGAEKIAGWRDNGLPFLEAHQTTDVDMPHVKIERGKGGDISGYKIYQPHAHVLVSPRAWDSETGDWAKDKQRLFDKHEMAMQWRYEWPKLQNRHLAQAGWDDVEVSCTAAGEGDEAMPRKRTQTANTAHHIERRGVDTSEAKIVERNHFHNDMIQRAANDAPSNEAEEMSRREQVARWWANVRDRLPEHKAALKEKATHYIRMLGHRLRPDKSNRPDQEKPEPVIHDGHIEQQEHDRGQDYAPDPHS